MRPGDDCEVAGPPSALAMRCMFWLVGCDERATCEGVRESGSYFLCDAHGRRFLEVCEHMGVAALVVA